MHFSGLFTVRFGGKDRDDCKLLALVYDILPWTTAVFSYAIGPRKLSANEQFFVGAQTVVSLLQTAQIMSDVCFYNWPCCLRHSLPPPLNSRLSFVVDTILLIALRIILLLLFFPPFFFPCGPSEYNTSPSTISTNDWWRFPCWEPTEYDLASDQIYVYRQLVTDPEGWKYSYLHV